MTSPPDAAIATTSAAADVTATTARIHNTMEQVIEGKPEAALGYPSQIAELAMIDIHGGASPLDDLEPATDGQALAVSVLAHRLLTTAESQIGRRNSTHVLHDIIRTVPLPNPSR